MFYKHFLFCFQVLLAQESEYKVQFFSMYFHEGLLDTLKSTCTTSLQGSNLIFSSVQCECTPRVIFNLQGKALENLLAWI